MASISGFSNLNNYSFLFSNTSSNKTNSLDLFSNSGSNPLGDYALIKSGVYKKLLNAYYQKNGTTDKTTSTTDGEEDSTQTLTTKLNDASISDLTSLFKGSGSYGDSVSKKANEVYKLANNTAMSNTHASSYTFNGTYSTMGTSSGSINKYL